MATQSISININLNALRGELQRSLQRTIFLVAAGLQRVEHVDSKLLTLPTGGIDITIDPSLELSKAEVQQEYTEWILANGFRDAIESTSMFLESAHRVLSFWALAAKQQEGIEITGEHWNQVVITEPQKFNRLGLPDKLSHIREKHQVPLEASLESQVLSINTARNCLVHRNGLVSERDINLNDSLEVKWSRLQLVLQNEDGEKEVVLGEVVEKESKVMIRYIQESKLFSLGDSIKFSAKEFAEISGCLYFFGESLVIKMNEYGIQEGLLPEEAKSLENA